MKKMNRFAWVAILEVVSLQLIFPSIAFAYTYELNLGSPTWETASRTEDITINNCDNNQAEPYDIQNRLQISQRLSFNVGWKISPGLEVSIPGVPVSLNVSTELSRTVGNEFSIINETNRSLTGSVPAGVHKIIHVSIEDELARGTAVVYKQPSSWWERFLPSDSRIALSPYTAYGRRRVVNIQYRNISCFAGKWTLDWSQWQEKPSSAGTSPIGGLAGGYLTVDDNNSVIVEYIFSYFTLSGNRSRYSIYCRGSLVENGLEGVIQPIDGSIQTQNFEEFKELENRYTDVTEVYLTLCGRGKTRNTNQFILFPFQVRVQTQANNRVVVMENHETRSLWYQQK